MNPEKRYTYADYLTWWDDKRRELVDGFVKLMSPAPSSRHAEVSLNIAAPLKLHIKKHKGKCKVFTAPFDVRLPKDGITSDNQIYTVVQPDICVVCDRSKLDARGCLGAPDMVAEILSPSTLSYDLTQKRSIYQCAGVKEYWVVAPLERTVIVYLLQPDGTYGLGTTYLEGNVPMATLSGLELSIDDIFEE